MSVGRVARRHLADPIETLSDFDHKAALLHSWGSGGTTCSPVAADCWSPQRLGRGGVPGT